MENRIIPPEIKTFLEKLLEDKKIKVSDDLKEMMVSDLYDRLEVRFFQLIIEHLSPSELDTLSELASEGQEEVRAFLRKNIKDIDKLFAEAMEEFREAFLAG